MVAGVSLVSSGVSAWWQECWHVGMAALPSVLRGIGMVVATGLVILVSSVATERWRLEKFNRQADQARAGRQACTLKSRADVVIAGMHSEPWPCRWIVALNHRLLQTCLNKLIPQRHTQ